MTWKDLSTTAALNSAPPVLICFGRHAWQWSFSCFDTGIRGCHNFQAEGTRAVPSHQSQGKRLEKKKPRLSTTLCFAGDKFGKFDNKGTAIDLRKTFVNTRSHTSRRNLSANSFSGSYHSYHSYRHFVNSCFNSILAEACWAQSHMSS